LAEAKALKVTASRAAENGIAEAIRQANESAWLLENKEAIANYNKRIRKGGTFFTPEWVNSDLRHVDTRIVVPSRAAPRRSRVTGR
jgi:hypothetical protein